MKTQIMNFSLGSNLSRISLASLICLCMLTIGVGNVWGAAATLPVNYSFTGGKSSLPTGVTHSGLGSNYAAVNSPYLLKFDDKDDYIQIQVDAAAETITIGVKEFGSSGASIQIQGSADGSSFTTIQTLSFSQGQNKTSSQSTNNSISSSYKHFRVKRNSGSNFGLGTLAITKAAASCTTSPTVTAASNSSVTATTATVTCSLGISSLGSAGCSITDYGFVIGTSANPTIGGSGVVTKHQVGTTYTSTGASFSKDLTGLSAETTYYVRPYATNGNGTAYGTQTSFKTLELSKYTVTLNAGPGTCAASVTEPNAGAGVTLPTPTLDGCGDWTFAGWKTTSAVTTETTTEPTLIPAGAYSPTSDITLYAVYQRTETTSGGGGGGDETAKVVIADYASANDWSDATKYTSVTIDENITATASTGSNTGKYYTTGTNWRFYQTENATLTLSAATGCTIKTVKVTYSVSNTGVLTYEGSNKISDTTIEINATSATFGVGNTGSATTGQVRITAIEVSYTTSGGGSTTYYHSTPDCSTPAPTKLATPTNLQVTNITSTSATLSWGEVANASSYTVFITDLDEEEITLTDIEEASVDVTGLSPETLYLWDVVAIGDGANYTDSEHSSQEDPNAEFTTLTACADAVTISKGTETNGTFTLSTTGQQSTCNGPVIVTLSDIEPATGYQFSEITQSEVDAAKVTIDNTAKTVTYAQNTSGTSTINVTFIEIPKYTVTFNAGSGTCDDESLTEASGGAGVTLPTANPPAACATDGWGFAGWWTEEVSSTTTSPGELLTAGSNYKPASDCTLYAVYSYTEAGGGGSGFYLSVTEDATTYYIGEKGSGSYLSAVTDVNSAATFNIENNQYLYYGNNTYVSSTSDNTSLTIATTTPSATWAITEEGETITFKSNGTGGRYLAFNYNSGSPRFSSYYSTYTYELTKHTTSTTTYNSKPNCLEPVLSFATEPADPIVFTDVACGGNSSKQSVTVVGENLRDVVNVSVTGPYKIARTASTALKDFTTSLTLDKTAGGAIHSNYQTVYIISTPPAQSTEATTGTLTFTTTKGNTLTVNLSTPTVTCTQYTLTLVDRGVSTVQPTKYYAGETINEAPADPEGVCTDPIHYVFDGWAEATVAAGSTTYTKVTFPYTVTGNTKFYAVYRYVEGGGNGDYNLVTSALDDWSGDYLIAYSDEIFANRTIGGESGIGAKNNKVDLSSNISNNTIPATVGDQYNVTLEAVTGGYVLKTQDGKYNYHTNNTGNGISASTIGYADDYPISVDFVSQEEINLCLGGSAIGSKFRYNTDGYFRFYKNGGQQPVYLYKKADGTTYYTTSPVCGPHLAITEGKEIYVTGGNAGGTRDLVIAQQKVSYKATRLQTSNGLDDGTAPDVKVATNGITVGGVVTPDVKVTIDQTKEQQTDGTYNITGTITVQYQPSANNKQEDIQVQLAVDYNAEARDNFTVHARSLPSEFVIVAKSGDKWYALNGDMNTNAANPANGQVTLDNDANPTKATYAPCNTIYTFDGLPNTGDRTYVRFQGTDGAWLWASSGTNVGIQNNVLKTTPEGNNNAYNWKLYTEDNITYRFGNANSSRQLTLSGEKFGMYASGVQDIRILPYDAKCLYNYAPTNLKVSVLKGTYVTLTWDAVIGATKYQYSTNATNWTDAGTEPTVTINGLTGDTEYTYYIRAYHEDAGVSQECIDYAEITFTTADCDDVPSDITYTADLSSITVSWTAAAPTATIKYNINEDGTGGGGIINDATSPYKISGGLKKNTTYYIQILADGTCASPIIPVKTEDVEVDIVEWYPQGIIVDINTDETVGVTLENEVSYGSGLGSLAEDLFFSKYFEGSGSLKMLAIYNGTGKDVDLSEYRIDRGSNGDATNISKTYDLSQLGIIKQGQEIIFYSWPLSSEYSYSCSQSFLDSKVQESGLDANPRWILCDAKTHNGIEFEAMDFSGNDPLLLYKSSELIDVFGVSTEQESPASTQICSGRSDEAWSADGVTNMDYGKTTEDFPNVEIPHGVNVDDETITAYTARVIMFRKNTVVSGTNAVTKNTTTFATFAEEWEARQVCMSGDDGDLTCAAYQELGSFNYSNYYTKYESMGESTTFEENDRNADGTVTIPITDLYKHACSNIRVKLTNSNSEVLSDREYKVPIMITDTQGTNGQAFLDLQQNLATKEVDGEGHVTAIHPLSLEEVREICKTCDVVVRDNATLTKVTDGTENDHPQVRNVYVYEGASIVIPDGDDHNYTINGLSLRRKGDVVASAQVQGTGKFVLPVDEPVCLDLRVDANNWHWFTLPYDCDIADVTWIDGTPAKYNTDWFLMYYDGESRAASTNPHDNHWKVYNGTTIEAGKGYIVGITGDLTHPDYTFELRFPMAQEVLTAEQTNKTVPVNAWGVESDNTPNNLGWNLVGNPYLNYYKTADDYSLAGLPLIHYTDTDSVTGEWYYENSGSVPYVVTPIDGGWYEYQQELASGVNMMPFTAYFVQVGDPNTHTNGQALDASFEASNRGKKSIVRRAPREVEEIEEPIIVRVELTNSKGESDKTSLVIDDRFTNEYEMNGDFFKWFGDYYNYYTKPVLYTIGADQGKRAFNALNEELAKQPIPMGMYAAQAGNYTFSLNQQFDLSRVEEVWLYDATQSTYTNLMQSDYTFSTSKVNGAGRFSLSVKLAPKVATSIDNVTADKVWATTHTKQVIVNGLENGMHLWLYDATGKLLYNEPTSNYQHTYSVPQTGTYFVSVMKGNAKQTIKVVVE